MPDDLTKRGPHDRARVNINQKHEIKGWCEKFKCSEEELKKAVEKVGDSVAALEVYFAKRK